MNTNTPIIILYIVAIIIIGFLLYTVLNRPQKIQIYNKIPAKQIETHWWGYGWRPWWRRYGGVPGFGKDKPLPEPKMPKPPKPIII
jgi:hypothetical protein